jgi:hypothetical protein
MKKKKARGPAHVPCFYFIGFIPNERNRMRQLASELDARKQLALWNLFNHVVICSNGRGRDLIEIAKDPIFEDCV